MEARSSRNIVLASASSVAGGTFGIPLRLVVRLGIRELQGERRAGEGLQARLTVVDVRRNGDVAVGKEAAGRAGSDGPSSKGVAKVERWMAGLGMWRDWPAIQTRRITAPVLALSAVLAVLVLLSVEK